MACPRCDHTMSKLGEAAVGVPVYWCPRCGSYKTVFSDQSSHQGTPSWSKSGADPRLVKVEKLDYSANYTYAPPTVETVVNPAHVVEADAADGRHRGCGPFTDLRMVGGEKMTIRSSVTAFLELCRKAGS